MKFALNGALTIGTLDGANVEIRDAVGPENFFLFGLSAGEVDRTRREAITAPLLRGQRGTARSARSHRGWVLHGRRSHRIQPLVESLLTRDDYLLLADYQAYVDCQERVSEAYRDRTNWTRMSILNSARVGHFSSDRSIRDYCRDIWHVAPITTPGTSE
jgi:starch phosphorylase